MPPVIIAATTELAAIGFSAAWAAFTVSVIESIGASVILGFVSSALTKKPNNNAAISASTDRTLTIKQPIIQRQIVIGQVKVGGALTFIRSYDTNARLEMVITLTGHPSQSVDTVYFDDGICTLDGSGNVTQTTAPDGTVNTNWNGFAQVVVGLGTTASDAAFMTHGQAAAPGVWTINHRQSGCTKMWITFKANSALFAGSIPQVSVIMSGIMPYDPRTTLSVFSSNPVLAIRYYMMWSNIIASDASDWDDTVAIASANTCDETVTSAGLGSETRYTCNGTIDTANAPDQVLPQLLSSCNGKLVFVGGKWKLLVGAYRSPSISFNEYDLDGPLKSTFRLSLRESYNRVKGTFYSPAASWQPTDFAPVINATYFAEDGNVPVWNDIQLPYTLTTSMAQRISKQLLEATRRQITTYWQCKLTALQVQVGDVVYLNRSRYGWVNKTFEVTDWQFVIRGSGQDMRLGIDMTLRETDANVYAYDPSEETVLPALPTTTLPNPWLVSTPGAPVVVCATYTTRTQTGVKASATVTWTTANDTSTFQPEYQLVGASSWIQLPKQTANTIVLNDITPGTYNFRVKAYNFINAPSLYATTTNVSVTGLTPTPNNITGLSLQAISSLASLHWDQSTDQDVLNGGTILVRHTPDDISIADWSTTVSIIPAVAGIANHAVAPLKAGTYMLKARNSNGLVSPTPAMIATKNATVLAYSNIGSVTESPTFSGTCSNCVKTANESFLKLVGTGDFDAIPDFDLISSIDAYGGVAASGTYTFAAGIDLGSVLNHHLVTTLAILAVNVLDNLDARAGNVDSWADWDQTPGGLVDAWIEERHTDTDPAGSPTWTAWNRLVTGDFTCRAFQFRLQMTSADTTVNIHVSSLGVTAQSI